MCMLGPNTHVCSFIEDLDWNGAPASLTRSPIACLTRTSTLAFPRGNRHVAAEKREPHGADDPEKDIECLSKKGFPPANGPTLLAVDY